MSRSPFNRIALLQALTVVALLLPLTGAGTYVWIHHQRILNHLAELEPRYARLAGLLEKENELKASTARVNQQLTQLTYPATQDVTQTGNDAQQRIRNVISESKIDIISIQVLAPQKEESKFDRIPINLRVEGDLSGFQNAMSRLLAQRPLVMVDSVSVQTIGAVRPASIQRLGGQFNFYVLRARS
jgi:general secretion pathway protein M